MADLWTYVTFIALHYVGADFFLFNSHIYKLTLLRNTLWDLR